MLKVPIENWWASDRESLITGQPSCQNIDALEDTDLLLFPKADFEKFAREVPAFARANRQIVEPHIHGQPSPHLNCR